MYQLNEFDSRTEIDQRLAAEVAETLSKAISEKGRASIAVSGGSTPKGFFQALSNYDLAWHKITVTLADERWVEFADQASNTRLVHEALLQNNAQAAQFFQLKRDGELTEQTLESIHREAVESLLPFDVLILGMGEDGHTASLFPCSTEIEQGLSTTAAVLKVEPTTAPHQRISFSFDALQQAGKTVLHICGDSKKTVLEQAIANRDNKKMPISAFLHHPSNELDIYWAQ
ncbi:6-phosphogluconolactonase [Endozoicomonas sp. G2_1]|uniref:6-phosphogluconolactonase n=1 Tax=Endozoicomonas sp. G2_1 TaxID=2821091 RepID=UPI001ADCEAED|nr:6-phosphogluconolactonase [Endozoicomonas sp. G2_1]MBO9490625.1 6-phosphogluconolactonase [Endozoicomonas sp. G2_1]